MSSTIRTGLCLIILLAAGPVVGADRPTPQEIATAVEQLGSDNFRKREKASAFLWAAGKAAEPALKKALRSPDKEVARRAREILDKSKYGIYPDTPKHLVDLVTRYRAGNDDVKRNIIQELSKLGSPGHAILIKFAAVEENEHLRRELFDRLTGDVIPGLLADRRYNEVEELLELGLKGGEEQALRNYAAYLYLRGELDARLPEWAKRAKKLTGYQDAEVLMYMYRTKGDLKNARLAAAKTGKKPLLAAVLVEDSDWKELAANHGPPNDSPDPLDQLAYTAAYQRLAGNTKDFDKTIAAIREFGTRNPEYARKVAVALLLNNRPLEGIDVLRKSNEISFAFDLLAAQHRYKEGFELAAKARADHDAEDLFRLKLALARAHTALGDKPQAARTLGDLADASRNPKDSSKSLQIVETAFQIGLKDEAFALCAKAAIQAEREEQLSRLLGHVFPEQGGQAAVWWKFFRRKHSDEGPADTVKRLRQVFEQKVPAKDFAALLKEAEKAATELTDKEEQARWFKALGETALAAGQQGPAQVYLEKAGTASSLTRLGDLLAEKKFWQQAAERYGQAWAKDRTQAVPLYLRGWALQQAGLKEDGQKLIELAHLIPLANDEVRFKLSQALARLGLNDAANREREFIVRTGRFHYAELSNALRFLGLVAYVNGDYARAADYHERTLLECLGNVYFIRPSAYLAVPASVHHMRARALIAAGKTDEALKEVRLCLAGLPGDIDGPIHFVPDLEKHGRKKEADEVFGQVFRHYDQVCRAYPKSAQHHNSLAWLAVCCRRQLDAALERARKAVELAPDTASYLDTLAEIHYQRGDKAEALRLMKKCIELDPRNDYFPKQVKRFKAPGPPSETPR